MVWLFEDVLDLGDYFELLLALYDLVQRPLFASLDESIVSLEYNRLHQEKVLPEKYKGQIFLPDQEKVLPEKYRVQIFLPDIK